MSATVPPPTDDSSKGDRFERYLPDHTKDGEMHFKSKFIADNIGLSLKEIGALMTEPRDSATDLSIEEWSYTSAATWHVETA